MMKSLFVKIYIRKFDHGHRPEIFNISQLRPFTNVPCLEAGYIPLFLPLRMEEVMVDVFIVL